MHADGSQGGRHPPPHRAPRRAPPVSRAPPRPRAPPPRTTGPRRAPPAGCAGARRHPPGTVHVPLSGRVLPGEGELPLRAVVEAALENSPDATVDLEVLNDELRARSADDAATQLADAAHAWRATLG